MKPLPEILGAVFSWGLIKSCYVDNPLSNYFVLYLGM